MIEDSFPGRDRRNANLNNKQLLIFHLSHLQTPKTSDQTCYRSEYEKIGDLEQGG